MALLNWNGLKNFGQKKQISGAEEGTGPAAKCEACGQLVMKRILEANFEVCPHCDHHRRLDAPRRIQLVADPGSFEEINADLGSKDILEFRAAKTYKDSLDRAVDATRMLSALVTGSAALKGRPVALGACDFRFIMSSMGSVLGEKFVRLAEAALEDRKPLIIFGCSGGARMHEGLFSLMQMAKTSAVLGKLHDAAVPYIVVCCDPTTAGVWASWASLGDIIIAEPKALIGFTGARVIKATINCELPEGFQSSEFLLEHGQVDMIVHRRDLRDTLASLLDKLLGPVPEAASAAADV